MGTLAFRRRSILALVGAGVIAGALVAAVWTVWVLYSGPKAGPGAFAKELGECRHLLDQDIQHIPQEHLEATVWHEGNATKLWIGGKVRVTGDDFRPAIHDYKCLARNGRVLRVEVW